jgi:hypothetical protein
LRKMAKNPELKIPDEVVSNAAPAEVGEVAMEELEVGETEKVPNGPDAAGRVPTASASAASHSIDLTIFIPIAFLWFIQGFVYSGSLPFLGFFLVQSGVNPKLVFFLMALSEVPGVLLSGYLSTKHGRELTLKVFWCLATFAGLFLTLAVTFSSNRVLIGLACCTYYCFHIPVWGLLFVFTPELFPAQVRGRAGGWVSLVKTAPMVVAPFVGSWLTGMQRPGLFMGVWTVLIGVGAVGSVCWLKVPRGQTWN